MTQIALFDRVNPEPSPELAARMRERGMDRALTTAEAQYDAWATKAYAFLGAYARTHASFAGWELVRAANDSGQVPVVSGKAWGAVFVRAARAGLLEKAGFAPDPNRHNNPAPRWRSRIVPGPDTRQD